MTPLCPDRLGYNLIAAHENPNYSDNVLPIPPYGARWKHAYCWTHTPTHSVRIIRDVLDRMGDSQDVCGAWADRHSLVVETEYAVNFCMTDEYASWYDLITRRFISPIDPVEVDSGYQPGDAYFRRVMRDETSTIANICKGVAIEDLSREDLVEALTKSIVTAAFLHELTLKTPQQQQHQARSSTRRRQGRGDDLQSFETPDWRQSTSQTPLTSVSHQTSGGVDVGPSYVFSSPLSSSFFDFGQGSGGNDQADQGTAHQQSEFQTPPAYTTYQDSFMEDPIPQPAAVRTPRLHKCTPAATV
ncbi:serine/threonine-protein phosphatase 7 long form [Dorcoceras hygrometricum]|uniref:Serine/threonine-protein phosphatase 7 long form n=1 Tax=Dorcoceras hygrometricum TaxID=472368 RepID=A0A2Z7BHE4_9LAMI|nr:serine/threonine-protein phosphatase 7 long form [Dorcoceras hygrometricum]